MDTIEREIVIAAPARARVGDRHPARAHGPLVRRRRRRARRRRDQDALGGARRGRAARRRARSRRRVFAYRWDANVAGIGDTLVEFTLAPEGDGTRLKRRRERLAKLAHERGASRSACARATSAAGSTSSATSSATRRPSRCDRGRLHRARRPHPASILDLLATHGHGTATTLAAELPVSRPAVIKHLAVLDRAGLVAAQRHGREVRYVVCPRRWRRRRRGWPGWRRSGTRGWTRSARLAGQDDPEHAQHSSPTRSAARQREDGAGDMRQQQAVLQRRVHITACVGSQCSSSLARHGAQRGRKSLARGERKPVKHSLGGPATSTAVLTSGAEACRPATCPTRRA